MSALSLTACSDAGQSDEHGGASCAQVIAFDGQRYMDAGRVAKGTDSSETGRGSWVYCDDNDGNGEAPAGDTTSAADVPVLAVDGLDPKVAVAAVDPTGTTELFVIEGQENSPAVHKAITGR